MDYTQEIYSEETIGHINNMQWNQIKMIETELKCAHRYLDCPLKFDMLMLKIQEDIDDYSEFLINTAIDCVVDEFIRKAKAGANLLNMAYIGKDRVDSGIKRARDRWIYIPELNITIPYLTWCAEAVGMRCETLSKAIESGKKILGCYTFIEE